MGNERAKRAVAWLCEEGGNEMDSEDGLITVEVVYAMLTHQQLVSIKVHKGSTVLDAVRLANLLDYFSETDLTKVKFGIFGKVVRGDTALRHRDRVEVYRPLVADPKVIRQQRASVVKAKS